MSVVNAVSLAVVIIVCAVPEGLPLMISLVLMQNTSKMLDHNVLVRKAEGIETASQAEDLRAHGVEFLQGYYYSKPIPEDEFLQFVERHNQTVDELYVSLLDVTTDINPTPAN